MESQKIINLLDHKDDDDQTKKQKNWYTINGRYNGHYGNGDENDSTVTFSAEAVKTFLVDYSDAYIWVTGDIKVVVGIDNTKVAFINCHRLLEQLFNQHLDLTMNLCNLINYSDNY